MNTLLAAGGGFLVAVLWMDLMFDVLSFGAGAGNDLPEEALARIAAYYRRVTTEASPMNYAISAVMAAMVATLGVEIARGGPGRTLSIVSLALCGVPISLALTRIFPNAIRLGARKDPAREQSRLARSICRDHLACLAAMLAYLGTRWLAS